MVFHCRKCTGFLSFNKASHFTCTCLVFTLACIQFTSIFILMITWILILGTAGPTYWMGLTQAHPLIKYHLSDTRVYCFYVYHVTAYYIYIDYIVLDPIAHGFIPITWSLWVSGWKGSETGSALQVLGKGTLYLLWQAPIAGVVVFEHVIVSQVMSDYIWGSQTADHIEGDQHLKGYHSLCWICVIEQCKFMIQVWLKSYIILCIFFLKMFMHGNATSQTR